jgi:ABC-type Zn uptake system ZnuABC Zn-binding protein ZnuA
MFKKISDHWLTEIWCILYQLLQMCSCFPRRKMIFHKNVTAVTTQIIALLKEITNKLNTPKSMSNITNTNVVEYFCTLCYIKVKFLI